jgi:RNA polymerase sigma-70 factor (ECF subfamily)
VTESDVSQLLAAARLGDVEAFGGLVREYQDVIHGLVSRLVKSPEAAEELTQDAFIKAFKSLDSFRGDAKFSTWLYRIAVNVCHDYNASVAARIRRMETDLDQPDVQAMGSGGAEVRPDYMVMTRRLHKDFARCLEGLPPGNRVAFVLRHQEGMDYKDIAQVLSISESNAKVRVHRARDAVLKGLREMGHEV